MAFAVNDPKKLDKAIPQRRRSHSREGISPDAWWKRGR